MRTFINAGRCGNSQPRQSTDKQGWEERGGGEAGPAFGVLKVCWSDSWVRLPPVELLSTHEIGGGGGIGIFFEPEKGR